MSYLPYIAGFMDGEGCLSVHQCGIAKKKLANGIIREYFKGWTITVSMSNANKEVLEFIQSKMGGTIYTNIDKRKPNHNINYALTFTKQESIKNLLEPLLPFLIVKGKQAKIILQYLNSRMSKNKKNGQAFPYTPKEMELLKQLKIAQQVYSFKAKSFKEIPFSDRTEEKSLKFLKTRQRNNKGQFIPLN